MPLAVGETFAGYTIVRLIGSGGMGEVYLARHPRLPREDALKILRPELSSSEEFRQRFIREADLASALKHPNIVTVHDRGECAGQLWIATECVEGTDAAHLMVAKYPVGMPVEEAVAIITPIASALDFAHEKGLLHRDVKPANILLSQPDHTGHRRVFLADFGIARPTADPNGLTATNLTLGTVAYSAPEQLMGEPIDARADQYALAATAYHLLTGVQLFPNSNPAVVISHHLNAPVPSLSDTRAELAKLDPVLGVGLAKDPKGRFMRCADFAHALADRNSSPDSAVAPTQSAQVRQRPTPDTTKNTPAEPIRRGSSSRPWLMAAVAVAVLFAMVSAVVFWHPWSRDNPKAGVGTNTADPSPAVTTTTTSSTSLPPPPPATIAATPTAPSTTQAMTVSPTQQLSNYDVVFLQRLRDHGFPSDNPHLNISLASQVCLRLAHLSSQFPVPLHNEIPVAWYFYQREQSLGWTVDDWNFFVGNAVSSYCPEYR